MSSLVPPGMHPVSPTLAKVRLIGNGIWLLIFLAGAVAAGLAWGGRWWLATAAVVALALWLVWLIPGQVRNMAWLETEEEFIITRGKMWHTMTIVPYGRIQFVDVTAGPVARPFGLKTVNLHTASPSTDGTVKGLPAADADALRARLTERARERMSGL